MQKYYFTVLVTLCLLLTTCKKDNETPCQNNQTKSLSQIEWVGPIKSYCKYIYNDKNQIISSIEMSINESTYQQKIQYEYDTQGRCKEYRTYNEKNQLSSIIEFKYEENKLIATYKSADADQHNNKTLYVFDLNGDGMPKLLTINHFYKNEPASNIIYEFECEGKNITKVKRVNDLFTETHIFTYDNQKSFYGKFIGDKNYISLNNEAFFTNWFPSENNVTSQNFERIFFDNSLDNNKFEYGIKYSYLYDNDGYPYNIKTGNSHSRYEFKIEYK
ncbi:MAG: hypothetical protein ACEPOW_09830 [Bacteroidales bacterium]